MAAIVQPGPIRTRSDLEDLAFDFLQSHGFPPPETNTHVEGIEVDVFYPDRDLVIEIDSAKYHGTPLARADDARKQAILESAGYRVLRLTDDQLESQEEQTVLRLRQAWRDTAASRRSA